MNGNSFHIHRVKGKKAHSKDSKIHRLTTDFDRKEFAEKQQKFEKKILERGNRGKTF